MHIQVTIGYTNFIIENASIEVVEAIQRAIPSDTGFIDGKAVPYSIDSKIGISIIPKSSFPVMKAQEYYEALTARQKERERSESLQTVGEMVNEDQTKALATGVHVTRL